MLFIVHCSLSIPFLLSAVPLYEIMNSRLTLSELISLLFELGLSLHYTRSEPLIREYSLCARVLCCMKLVWLRESCSSGTSWWVHLTVCQNLISCRTSWSDLRGREVTNSQRKCCYIVTSLINLVWLARIFFSKIFTPRRDVVAGLLRLVLRSFYLNMGMNCVLIIRNVQSDVWGTLAVERL